MDVSQTANSEFSEVESIVPTVPVTSYFICATPRSGSTLLCDLLARTGVAGNPESYFRRQSIPYWARELKVAGDDQSTEPTIDRAFIAAVKATQALLEGRSLGAVDNWLYLSAGFDVLYLMLALLTFEFVLEDG